MCILYAGDVVSYDAHSCVNAGVYSNRIGGVQPRYTMPRLWLWTKKNHTHVTSITLRFVIYYRSSYPLLLVTLAVKSRHLVSNTSKGSTP